MEEIENLSEQVRIHLKLSYDADSVKRVEEFIEQTKSHLNSDAQQGLANSMGAFLGQCIIKNYGGRWLSDEKFKTICVALPSGDRLYPFAKTAKQFENGLEDSIYSFFTVIPTVFKL